MARLIPINRICPRCGNGNYMRIITGKNVGKLGVKCINCNSYYNYDELLKGDNSKPLNGKNERTMDDLISRAAARDVINTWGLKENDDVRMGLLHKDLDAIPAVDAMPVVHAWWKDNGNETVSCSRCATWFPKEREPYLRYCGWCGAKMDGERREARG